ncbi:g1654 [Coccomyxa viridis]|uniref:G1654 protein n=1 Tax=Coccomyxa viridis TaxID=1274662 RepID=A0ABP1FM95_9CHLO
MGSEKKLSEISNSLSETLQRIDTLQKQSKTSWLTRFRQHLAKNNQHLHSIILAGCVFAVAAGRLQQKSEYEAEKGKWEKEQADLMSRIERIQQSCRQQEAAREQLQYSIRSELDTRGWSMWPSGSLSSRIHRALQDDILQEERMSPGGGPEQVDQQR